MAVAVYLSLQRITHFPEAYFDAFSKKTAEAFDTSTHDRRTGAGELLLFWYRLVCRVASQVS